MEKMVIPDPLPPDGFRVPLRACFTGTKGSAWVAMSHNSIAPLLQLYGDGAKFRVFIPRRKSYGDIELVDARQTIGTQNVRLVWKDSNFTFVGNLGDAENLRTLLAFFEQKGAPLSDNARRLLHAPVTRPGG